MANNCLVTKLKSAVYNDNLPLLGIVKIHVNVTTPITRTSVIKVNDQTEIYTDGNKNLYYEGVSQGSSITASDALRFETRDTGEYNLFIKPKYNVGGGRWFLNVPTTFDVEEFKYMSMTSIESSAITKYKGDIVSLKGKPLTAVAFEASPELYGSFEDTFGDMTSLISFAFGGTNITGDIVPFVQRQVKAGRTSHTFSGDNVAYLGAAEGIKFNGNRIPNSAYTTLSWENNSQDSTKTDITLSTGQTPTVQTVTVPKI